MNSRAHEVARPGALIWSLRVIFTISHVVAFTIVNNSAPEPYIDEMFHVSQCQAYCQGRFSEWNDKITTPPGL
jgi:alpha-1,2-glucosyltransferase